MKNARILCVDDEPKVLEGLARTLHRKCTLLTAGSGDEALRLLAGPEPFAVIVSDMRMPGMNGAALLAECRKRAPETVRVLLTGQSDLDSAISAVNEGHVFRFLTKPCPPPTFLEALGMAVEQHRLITSERVLLEQTLVGSVRALTEVIALVHPEAFGMTARQHERARLVAAQLQVPHAWQVEVASMLAQVGYVVLPNDLLAKMHTGTSLDAAERGMLARVPAVVERVLALIPRLEAVQEIIKHKDTPFSVGAGSAGALPIGSRILRALSALGVEESRSASTATALAVLHARRGEFDPEVLSAIAAVCAPQAPVVREVGLRELEVGMILASDVTTKASTLLVSRGHPVTAQLIERLLNFDLKFGVVQPIVCELPSDAEAPKRAAS